MFLWAKKKAQNLFICCVVSCYEVRLPIVAKTGRSNCLFLWSYYMFPWTLHRWHEVFSPESDWVPCWCFLHLRPCSSAFHRGEFLMLPFLFDLVLFMSSPVGEKGLSLHVALHQSMWCLLAGSSTTNLEYTYSKGKPIKMWRQVLEDTNQRSEEREQDCQHGNESLGRNQEIQIEVHQGPNEWGLDFRIVWNKEIDGFRKRNGIAVELDISDLLTFWAVKENGKRWRLENKTVQEMEIWSLEVRGPGVIQWG